MFTNWLTYARVAEELDALLRGARIAAVFTQQKHEFVVEVETTAGVRYLVLTTRPRLASMQLKDDFARARRNALDLLPDAIGERITMVSVAADDRIVRCMLDSGRALYIPLFPQRANLLLMDGDALVDSCTRNDRVAEIVDHPFDALIEPPAVQDFQTALSSFEASLGHALRHVRPWLSGRVADELLHRAGLPSDRPAFEITSDEHTHLCVHLRAMLEEADQGMSHVYLHGRQPLCFSLVALRHLTDGAADMLQVEQFPTALDGVAFFLRRVHTDGEFSGTRDRVRKALAREIERIDRILEKLVPPARLRKQADEYEKFGNLLMIHLYDQPTQPGVMVVPDLFGDARLVVSIPLKPRVTVLENAQMYFGKAQTTRMSVDHVIERTAAMETRKEKLGSFLAAVDEAREAHTLRTLFKEHAGIMEELGLTPKGEKDAAPFPFRRFVVMGGFEVWAGKNSANNDLLTVRHSRPNDLWFHARGVGGSHVVLKVGSAAGVPAKEAIRQAAAIAAYYSKHRNAKRVPVAYTEKKYVRKPKGAAPGSVMVEREKVIMVDPALPEGAKDED